MVNSAQNSESHRAIKKKALKAQSKLYEEQGANMKTSTEDKIKGSLHEVKGAIKEQAGKVTNNCCLEAKGKVEKTAGKVQHRVGDAEAAVEKLKK